MIPQWAREVAKALAGAALAGIAAATTALLNDHHIEVIEWLAIAAAVIGSGYTVWRVPNADPTYDVNKK